jgi:hypothetical protein
MGGMNLKNLSPALFRYDFLTTLYIPHNALAELPLVLVFAVGVGSRRRQRRTRRPIRCCCARPRRSQRRRTTITDRRVLQEEQEGETRS